MEDSHRLALTQANRQIYAELSPMIHRCLTTVDLFKLAYPGPLSCRSSCGTRRLLSRLPVSLTHLIKYARLPFMVAKSESWSSTVTSAFPNLKRITWLFGRAVVHIHEIIANMPKHERRWTDYTLSAFVDMLKAPENWSKLHEAAREKLLHPGNQRACYRLCDEIEFRCHVLEMISQRHEPLWVRNQDSPPLSNVDTNCVVRYTEAGQRWPMESICREWSSHSPVRERPLQ